MAGQVLAFSTNFESAGECVTCGVLILLPVAVKEMALRDHTRTFYCVNGHPQHYIGKTEAEKLREQLVQKERQLEFERQRAATNFAEREKAERELKKIKRRTSGGACPCCKRSFVALARHMATKHPEFVAEAAPK